MIAPTVVWMIDEAGFRKLRCYYTMSLNVVADHKVEKTKTFGFEKLFI